MGFSFIDKQKTEKYLQNMENKFVYTAYYTLKISVLTDYFYLFRIIFLMLL